MAAYITNDGKKVYTYYEYLLDVIDTNLKCYPEDFFRNTDNFGCDSVNLSDTKLVEGMLKKIIKNRCSGKVSLGSVEIDGDSLKISLNWSDSVGQITIEKKDGIFEVQKL